MTETKRTDAISQLDRPVDLLHFIYLLWDTKWVTVFGSLGCAVLMMAYSLGLPNIYESTALTAIIHPGDAGGVDPKNRQAAESIGLLESGFVLATSKENYANTVMSRLRSRKFIRLFLDKHDIYKLIYKQEWDTELKKWKDDFVLDKGLAFIRFEQEFLSIVQNEDSELVAVRMRNTDPVVAADLANLYVKEFNDYMRQISLVEIDAKIEFLKKNLEQAKFIEIEKMLYRLMEAQTAAATLTEGQEEYALEVVDPATRSYDRYSPFRKRMAALAFFGSAFLIVFLIVLLDLLKSVKRDLDIYTGDRGRIPVFERPWSLRGILMRLLASLKKPFQLSGAGINKKEAEENASR